MTQPAYNTKPDVLFGFRLLQSNLAVVPVGRGMGACTTYETVGTRDRLDHWAVIENQLDERYEILEILGQGTFGRVCKCKDRLTREVVAIKIVVSYEDWRDEIHTSDEVCILQKLCQSVRFCGDLNHERISMMTIMSFVYKAIFISLDIFALW